MEFIILFKGNRANNTKGKRKSDQSEQKASSNYARPGPTEDMRGKAAECGPFWLSAAPRPNTAERHDRHSPDFPAVGPTTPFPSQPPINSHNGQQGTMEVTEKASAPLQAAKLP